VVAKIKDAADKSADSLRTLQLMQLIAERAAEMAQDSSQRFAQDTERNSADSTMIMQSIEREEEISAVGNLPVAVNMPNVNNNTIIAPKPAVVSNQQKVGTVAKVTTKGAPKQIPKGSPKILMPKGNN
jgi:hypothetical protein